MYIVGQGLNMRLLSFTFLILLFSVSCAPVNVDKIVDEAIDENVAVEASVKASSSDSRSVIISFPIVSGATEYAVNAEDSSNSDVPAVSGTVSEMDYSNGLYHVELSDLIPGGKYTINVEAKNSANDSFVSVAEIDYSLPAAPPLVSEAPLFSIVPSFEKTSLDVVIETKPGFKYLVSMQSTQNARSTGSDEIIIGTGNDEVVTFDTDPQAVCSISVRYAYVTVSDALLKNDGSDVKEIGKEIDLKAYDGNLEVEVNADSFIISGISEEARSVSVGTEDGSFRSPSVSEIENGQAVIPSSFLEPLQSGAFYAFAVYDGGYETKSAQPVRYTKPLDRIDTAVNYQSAKLSWSIGTGVSIDTKKSSVEITDVSGSKIESNKTPQVSISSSGVELSALDSNTSYNVAISLSTSAGGEYKTDLEIQTKSFEGIYRWDNPDYKESDGKRESFEINVMPASSDSNYHYWIYVSEYDPDNKEHKKNLRMLPLIDTNEVFTEKIKPSSPGNYAAENESYIWNYNKWATMNATINYWYPSSSDKSKQNENFRDYVKTYVTTNAFVEVITITSWEFRENENGEPEIIFRNEGTGLASIGMFTNKSWQTDGLKDKWSFRLSYVSDGDL